MGDITNLTMNWRSAMMLIVCLPVFIAAITLWRNKVERTPSRYLSAALVVTILSVMPQIIGFAGFYNVWPGLTFFPFSNDLWLGPLLYLHAYSLMTGGKLGWRRYLLVPGIIQTTYYSACFLFLGDYQAKWAYNDALHYPYIYPVETTLSVVFLFASLVFIWKLYGSYLAFLNTTQSTLADFDPVWIKRSVQISLLTALLFFLFEVLNATMGLSYVGGFPFLVAIMLCIAWLSIEAIWGLKESYPKPSYSKPSRDNDALAEEPSKPSQPSSLNGELIKQQVKQNAWYLQARFSLKDLSAKLGTNETYVSRAINQDLHKSFNDFINDLRVEHAQQLINQSLTQQIKLALYPLALDSGFNSKATFNRVFKQTTGITPSQYIKKSHIL